MKPKKRYQLYFILMDIAFVSCWFGVAAQFWNYLGHEDPSHPIMQALYMICSICSLLIPIFLVLAKFMQDQYISDLLQKTSATLMKFILTFYPALLLCGGLVFIASNTLSAQIYELILQSPIGVFMGHLSDASALDGILYCWIMSSIAFTSIFEWHRWRASR